MSKAFRDHFSRQFSINKKNGEGSILSILHENKSRQPVETYSDLIKALNKSVPAVAHGRRFKGRLHFKDLLWNSRGEPTTVTREFAFARLWLQDGAASINEFRATVADIQDALLVEDYDGALAQVVKHRHLYGWTVWGVELEFAIATISMSAKETRNYLSNLTDNASPRIASLFGQVVRDRNDPSVTIGGFIGKCLRSFPRVGIAVESQQYLLYRSHGYIQNFEEAPSVLLTADLANSLIDYYETLIDLCATMVVENLSSNIIEEIRLLSEDLIQIGITDFRLKKINFAAGGKPQFSEFESCSNALEFILQKVSSFSTDKNEIFSPLITEIAEKIDLVQQEGSVAQQEISWLLKFGLNFRGLPIGSAVCGFAMKAANSIATEGVCSPWGQFASPRYRIEEILGLGIERSLQLIQNLAETPPNLELGAEAESLILASANNFSVKGFDSPIILMWAIRQLAHRRNFEVAHVFISQLACLGPSGDRQATRLRILIALKEENILAALESAKNLLVQNGEYASDLPLKELFYRTKWSIYKGIDPVTVAIVAHWAFAVTGDSNARYICRMACRAFNLSDARTRISDDSRGPDVENIQAIIAFFRDVWIDDNLTMAGYQSTQEVRKERISVLQLLLQLDNSVAQEGYAQEIKELTFSETLWQGLQHIESSRVFVNEGAISRWAEKDLMPDFNRWKALVGSADISIPSVDDVLRHYLLGDASVLTDAMRSQDITEVDSVLMGVVDRLLDRFLTDPADGLNCYLSSRIRHGSLKGILLGPLEDSGFLGLTVEDIQKDWRVKMGDVDPALVDFIARYLSEFDVHINRIATRLVSDIVQIRSRENPEGRIFPDISQEFKVSSFSAMAKDMAFTNFVLGCYDIFWLVLTPSLNALSEYIRGEVKHEIQSQFETTISKLRALGDSTVTITTSLRTVATSTQGQCDIIANWFQTGRQLDKLVFSLDAAIEIAKTSTSNVYRAFPVTAVSTSLPLQTIPLTSLGLSAVTDCLYIMLENAFKHSGLRATLTSIQIVVDFSLDNRILGISVSHPLSEDRFLELAAGGLIDLQERYIDNASIDRAPAEGGSGFAKLSRLVRTVDREIYPNPLGVGLDEHGIFTVTIFIPVYQRGEAYDAYFA